jgi:putative endonuclease
MKKDRLRGRAERGQRGEDAAAAWLESRGCRIVAKNFRRPFGELDLVALEGDRLLFVEVRSTSRGFLGDITDSVNDKKQKRLTRIADYFLETHPKLGEETEFVVIGVRFEGDEPVIERVVRDAF